MESDMAPGRFRTNFLVGMLTLLTLVVLALVTGFLLEKDNPLKPRFRLSARFAEVGGLKVGDPVALAGKTIGTVEGITTSAPSERWPAPGYLVHLKLEDRDEDREWIREDSTFRIVNDNLFGNRKVEISFGTEGARLARGAQVDGEIASGFDDLEETVADLRAVVAEVRLFLMGDGESRPAISDSLADLQETLANTQAISESLKEAFEGEGAADLGTAMKDLQTSAANVKEVSGTLKSSVDSVGNTIDKLKFWRAWTSSDDEEEEGKEPKEGEETGKEKDPEG